MKLIERNIMINKLKKMKIEAMKTKDDVIKSILSLLHSDALVHAKKELRDVCDADIIKASKTLIKKNEQTITLIEKQKSVLPGSIIVEQMVLKEFLPVQLTEDEIKKFADAVLNDLNEDELIRKNQGTIMKILKKLYGDTINMGIAAKYVSGKLK
jgi:hypothetical protein